MLTYKSNTLRFIHMNNTHTTEFSDLPAGLKISRLTGSFFGCFLIYWGLNAFTRWGDSPVIIAYCLFLCFYAILLILPSHKMHKLISMNKLLIILALLSVIFVFSQIAEIMFGIYRTTEAEMRPKSPILQSVMIFIALLQIPTFYFIYNPKALE